MGGGDCCISNIAVIEDKTMMDFAYIGAMFVILYCLTILGILSLCEFTRGEKWERKKYYAPIPRGRGWEEIVWRAKQFILTKEKYESKT